MRWVVGAALLCLVLVSGAQAAPFEGTFTSGRLDLEGCVVQGPASFLGIPWFGLDPDAEGVRVLAARAVLVYESQNYTQVAGLGQVDVDPTGANGPWRTEPQRFEAVEALSFRIGGTAFLQAEDPEARDAATTARFAVEASPDAIVPRAGLEFPSSGTGTGSRWSPGYSTQTLGAHATGSSGEMVVRGTFLLTVYDVDFRLRHAEGTLVVESGDLPREGSTAPAPLLEERQQRKAFLYLEDATLAIDAAETPFEGFYREASVVVEGSATYEDARGSIAFARSPVDLDGQVLRLDGSYSGRIAVYGTGPRLEHSVSGQSTGVFLDGAELGVAATATQGPFSDSTVAMVASLVLVSAMGAWLALRLRGQRLEQDTLVTAAAWALERGKTRQAARWSRRAMRDGKDADAQVLHAVALLRGGRTEEATRFLEERIKATPEGSGELELTLGLGLLHSDPDGARKHLRDAVRTDPGLLELLRAGAEARA